MAKTKKDSINIHAKNMDDIFGKNTEERRIADRVLDRRGIPSDYKSQYVAEKDMQGQSKKNLAAKSRQEVLKERRATAQERL